jgi:hypothetical protein
MKHDPPPPALQPVLARLKADLEAQQPPPMAWPVWQTAPQPALAAEGPAAPERAPGLGPAGRAMVVIGAAVLTALALAWLLRPLPPPERVRPEPAQLVDDAGGGSGFLPVAPPERFAELWHGGALAAPAWVVRTELPRERLAAFGLPYDPARAGEPVRAELLMHPAGDVLAVRLTP